MTEVFKMHVKVFVMHVNNLLCICKLHKMHVIFFHTCETIFPCEFLYTRKIIVLFMQISSVHMIFFFPYVKHFGRACKNAYTCETVFYCIYSENFRQ